MISTVIFDMDGVIVDTEPIHFLAYQKHFRELGIDVSKELYSTFTGNSTRNIYQKLMDRFGIEGELDQLAATKTRLFHDAFDATADLSLLDGVEDLIRDLNANGMQLLLASSSANKTIQKVFERFDLGRFFSHVVSGEDFVQSKPDPAIFLKAVELSGDTSARCVVIEDSANGVRGAKAAGIFTIGYQSEHSILQDLSEADLVISDFRELSYERIRTLND